MMRYDTSLLLIIRLNLVITAQLKRIVKPHLKYFFQVWPTKQILLQKLFIIIHGILMNQLLRRLQKPAYRIQSLLLSGYPVTSAVFRSFIKYMNSVFKKEILKALQYILFFFIFLIQLTINLKRNVYSCSHTLATAI